MTHFCPTCWHTVEAGAASCACCGGNLAALDQRPFVAKLIAALGKFEQAEAETLVVRALQHPASVVRLASLRALVGRGEPTATWALRQVAHYPSQSVRRLAREMEEGRQQC
jgi:HEAT repeat protein